MVKNPEQTTTFPPADGGFRNRLAIFNGDAAFDDTDSSAGSAPGLVSVGFLRSALRRHVRLWCGLAIVGLIIGCGYSIMKPPKYTASTSVVVVDQAQADPTAAIATDISLAESTPVAAAVVRQTWVAPNACQLPPYVHRRAGNNTDTVDNRERAEQQRRGAAGIGDRGAVPGVP